MAQTRGRNRIRLLGVAGRKRPDLLISTALQATTLLVLALPAAAQPAPNARPAGGSVVAGGATIAQTASTTTINQTSQRAAINWRSFNVGSNQDVTFSQPSSSAVALNRVTGPDPSQIAGRIAANGQIVLVNQAGVTFYKGAQVSAQSLIVTSANVSNANFMAGDMAFNQAGNANASVSNQGTITIRQAGLAALVAPNVANSGVINARLGHVVLAGAKTATIDLYGDGLLSLDVTNQVTKAPVGPGGKTVTALVTNSGVINADGGTVQLTAAAADGVLQKLVQAGGTITANSVGAATGTVTIAGIGGSVNVTGLVNAAGTAAGTTGGQVAVNATGAVTLAARARIDASGAVGGGTVAIGTTLARANGGPGTTASTTASNVFVRRGATINASATHSGNAGRVTVLSGNTTRMNGTVTATGGAKAGNGGFVEVSGTNLALNGSIDVAAPAGNVGTILLDPSFLAIIASGGPPGSAIDSEFVGGTLASGAPDGSPLPSTVLASTIQNMSSEGNIVIQATKTIDVQAPVALNNGLTLQAGGNLTVEGTASISAGGNILLQAGTAAATPNGAILLNGNVTSTQGSVQLIAGTGGIALNANVSGLNVDLNATGGGVTQRAGAIVTANTLLSSGGVTGDVVLLGGNAVQNLGNFAVTQSGPALFQMVDTVQLGVIGQVSAPAGQVYLRDTNAGGIVVAGGGTVTTGASGIASFQANAFAILQNVVNIGHGMVTTGTFELAPVNPKATVTVGANATTGLILPSLTNIASSAVRIGAVTQPASLRPGATAFAVVVNGTFDLQNRALELDVTNNVDGSLGPLINVGTLSGGGGVWSLPSNNAVTNIATINADSFVLNDTIGLNVAGALNGGAGATITDTGNLAVDGTVNATAVSLTASNIDIAGVVTDGGAGTVQLIANAGTIGETGTLISGVLTGSASGVADLLGAGAAINQVATLGNFTATSFALRDGVGLTVAGTATATGGSGQVFLESTVPAGITIATTGSVSANTSDGTVSLQTDSLANNAAVTAATIQLAPATTGATVTIGSASIASLAGLDAANILIGAVTQPGGIAPVATAGSIAFATATSFSGLSSLILEASSATAAGASGAITQSAPLTGVSDLGGTANSIDLTNGGNAIGILENLTATTGNLSVLSGIALTSFGVTASAGNVYLASTAAGGVTVSGPTNSAGIVGVLANAFKLSGQLPSITANTFELAPITSGATVTLGSNPGGLSLASLTNITASTVRIGAITLPGGVAPTIIAGSITIAATFNAAATKTLQLEASGAISQSAPLINVATLTAAGGSVILPNLGNTIAVSSGITATAGNVELADGESLALNGAYSGNDLFFEAASAGGSLTIGANGPATITAGAGARISLVADGLSANVTGSIGNAGGTVELAPFSSIGVNLTGTGGLAINAALLSSINVGNGTLVVGGFTNLPANATAPAATASSIALNGAVDLTGKAGTLTLLANGPITEPGGPLTVGTVTGASIGDFSLNNASNQIQASTGITAAGGNVILADDPTLVLSGLYSGNNLFFQVTQAGGSLALGSAAAPATLIAATGGRISLVADSMTATAASTITAPAGTLEIAPFSAINESLLGTNGSGQLLAGPTLLSDIVGGSQALNTLLIGGYTNLAANAATPTASASGITLDGALNLTTQAATLRLMANGPVSEPGGPLTVANVTGSSIGNFSLTNPANMITQSLGVTATSGDVVVVDGANLTLINAQSGGNLFFEVATPGGTLAIGSFRQPAELTAASGGRITLVADQMTENNEGSITAPAGNLELAPFSAINTSLLGSSSIGQLLIDPAMLSIITPGISTLTVGGFTNVPASAAGSAPAASSITIDGTVVLAPLATTLNLESSGAVTQSAAIVNVGTLLGTTGSTALSNPNNSVATLGNYIAGNGFALTNATNLLIAGTVTAGPSANFTVNGSLTETGAVNAEVLTGNAIGAASLTGNNAVAELNGFSVNGNFTLNDTGNLAIDGVLSATRIVVSDPLSQIALGNGATISTGGNVRPATPIAAASLLPQNGAAGAWLNAASFVQIGNSSVTGLGGGPSTLQISVTGNMRFDPPLGLSAPGTWLNLNLTNGSASGNVFVNALDVSYSLPGATNLFGSIDGITGQIAARFGFIQPARNAHYLFNNCEIAALTCGVISSPSQTPGFPTTSETVIYVPIEALLALVTPVLVLDPEDYDNLLQLPVVSKEDY